MAIKKFNVQIIVWTVYASKIMAIFARIIKLLFIFLTSTTAARIYELCLDNYRNVRFDLVLYLFYNEHTLDI